MDISFIFSKLECICTHNPSFIIGLLAIGVLALIKLKVRGPTLKVDRNIKNEVIIVTGGNTGIGFETALHLAKRGANVILACRDSNKGTDAVKRIIQSTNNTFVSFMPLDLSSFSSIKNFVKDFYQKFDRINILINNAGVLGSSTKQFTENGFEMMMGVNYYGTVYLTKLLQPLLDKTPQSRNIVVCSSAHQAFAKFDIDDLNLEKSYSRMVAYGNSKQAQILYFKELQRGINPNNSRIVLLHPAILPVYSIFTKNCYEGAVTQLYCALEDFEELLPGGYYEESALSKPTKLSYDRNLSKRLFDLTEKSINSIK